jgi:hypothetical protein
MKKQAKQRQENTGKRAYSRPKLLRFGKVSKITHGSGYVNDDGFSNLEAV